MNHRVLRGLGVLVTRPAGQCEGLCRLIVDRGGDALEWPAIEILPHDPEASAVAELASAGPDDLVIFVSRNAVRFGGPLVAAGGSVVTAVGPSSFRALGDAGIDAGLVPAGFDSESLLGMPQLADMAGRRVFIVRGRGGRELLADELRRRGARVVYVEVYSRHPRQPGVAEKMRLLDRWSNEGIGIYTATSVDILAALAEGLGPDFASLIASTPLVTASRRVVQRSEESGHRADRILAPAPDDASLVGAVSDWWHRTGSAASALANKE